jgi:hypothetical protein
MLLEESLQCYKITFIWYFGLRALLTKWAGVANNLFRTLKLQQALCATAITFILENSLYVTVCRQQYIYITTMGCVMKCFHSP